MFGKFFEKLSISLNWKGKKKKTNKTFQKEVDFGIQQQGANSLVQIFNLPANIIPEQISALVKPLDFNNSKKLASDLGEELLAERIFKRQNFNDTVKKANIPAIVNPREIEKDWFMKWRSVAQETSREEMQEVLANILASQIQKPNNFSLETLDKVKNLDKKRLIFLKKLLKFNISGRIFLPVKTFGDGMILNIYGIDYDEIIRGIEYGFLLSKTSSETYLKCPKGYFLRWHLNYLNKDICSNVTEDLILKLPCLIFSTFAKEIHLSLLSSLIKEKNKDSVEQYFNDLKKFIENKYKNKIIVS